VTRARSSGFTDVSSSLRALRDIANASAEEIEAWSESAYLRGRRDALEEAMGGRAGAAVAEAEAEARARATRLEREVAIDRGRVMEVSESVRMLTTRTIPALERAVGELRGRADARDGRRTWAGAAMDVAIGTVIRAELAIGALAIGVLFPSVAKKRATADAAETSAAEAPEAFAAPPPARVRVLGACLFLAVVEIAARASEFIDAHAPARARRSTAATARGLRVARAVAWSAALARGLAATKEKCHAVALAAHVALAPSPRASRPP